MYEQALGPAHFLCALGDILNCYTFAGIGGVVVAGFRNFDHTNELIVDHDALGAVFASALRFIHINVVDQFPEQRCGQGLHFHELAYGMDELILAGLHGIQVRDTATQFCNLFFQFHALHFVLVG